MMLNLEFYRGKRVLVTGHTGFKGAWLCRTLQNAGALVTGYAKLPPTDPALFDLANISEEMTSVIGDVCDFDALKACFDEARPEIVLHLAAQPIVRESYKNPRGTYETNVMGTVHLLECVRMTNCVRSLVNVTTDKVYRNNEWEWGYRENDRLDGFDPYSNSKSCSELITRSFRDSFFADARVAISTARAGNVIGGGDFADDRILPDCIRAAMAGKKITVRNPSSVRPYQHVLDPVMAYLMIAQAQYENGRTAGCYNVGPDESDCYRTGELVDLFCRTWGEGTSWVAKGDGGPHEAGLLKLDCSRLKSTFGWHPVWDLPNAVKATVEFSKCLRDGGDLGACMDRQIKEFLSESDWCFQ